jgi:hypothetical protein
MRFSDFLRIFSRCCAGLTAEEMFTKQMHQETDAEKEVLDLKRMQVIHKLIYLILKRFDNKKNIFTVTYKGIIYLFLVVFLLSIFAYACDLVSFLFCCVGIKMNLFK